MLLCAAFVALDARAIAATLWAMLVVDPLAGLGALVRRGLAAVGADLLVWLAAGLAVTAGAGRRRCPSRDFELAVVAWLPFFAVRLLASLGAQVAGVAPGRELRTGASALGLAFAAAWAALAVAHARRRPA